MNYQEALKWGAYKLSAKKINSPLLEAQMILCHSLRKTKEDIIAHGEIKLTGNKLSAYRQFISRRSRHEPLAHIIGKKYFFGLEFIVNKDVLIPRPDTEVLVENVLASVKKMKNIKLSIADIGTGSGCIAIALKKYLPSCRMIATDISVKSLTIARKNARLNRVDIKFIKSDLLEKIKSEKIDIIAANLPYLNRPKTKNSSAQKISLDFEPDGALFSAGGGLDHYDRLFDQISRLPMVPKLIFCEIGHNQAKRILKLANKYFPLSIMQIKKDYSGFDRILEIKK